jgi:hypothetical protein
MPAGILWVASRIKKPTLSHEKFCSWYENVHIQEVTALSGVPRAARYEGIQPSPFPGALSDDAPWLTVYEMPDIGFRENKAFRGLDGQSEPKKELLEGVFKQARFDTRFYECIQVHENKGGAKKGMALLSSICQVWAMTDWCYLGPASLLISAALTPAAGKEADFDAWYRQEHLPLIGECAGYRRSRRFKLVNATALDEFKRIEPQVPSYLAIHEFDGEELPMSELAKVDETEWSKKVVAGLESMEAGFYKLKRKYETVEKARL